MGRLLIKICGLTTKEDLRFCQEMGIDLTGFIFHPQSPRNINPATVGSWEKKNELRVGVFVGQSPEEIQKTAGAAGLDLVQLHGGQSRKDCMAVGPERVIRAFWPERFDSLEAFQKELDKFKDACRYFLLDSGKDSGGHGRKISSPWLKDIQSPRPYFLAGGLGPDNIRNVLDLNMSGLDLNSGVELSPGRKDFERIRKVLKIIRRSK